MVYLTTALLKQGKRDEFSVKQMQALFNLLGDRLVVDGDFGPQTTQSVKNFQRQVGITVDGLLGEKSWYKLYETAIFQATEESEKSYEVVSLDSNNRDLILLAQSLLYLLDRTTLSTRVYEAFMENQVMIFQTTMGLDVTGILDEETWNRLFSRVGEEVSKIDAMLLKDDFITQKAEENDLSPAAVKAVIKVESRGRGFDREKNLLILFEGHIFWRELEEIGLDPSSMVDGNEEIIYKRPDYRYYNRPQYPRLEKAKAINEEAALKSASYGMFQIMGFNHNAAGFEDVESMVSTLSESEDAQLEAFLTFIKNTTGAYEALQAKDWSKFARIYNGSAYKKNQYDKKLEKQYNSSSLTKGVVEMMDEDTFVSLYALELEKAFYEEKE